MLNSINKELNLEITYACDLKCPFCSQKNFDAVPTQNQKMLEFIRQDVSNEKYDIISIKGGEPTLDLDFLFKLLNLIRHELNYNGKVTVQTHGQLLTKEVIDYFIENKIRISLSNTLDFDSEYKNLNQIQEKNPTLFENLEKIKHMLCVIFVIENDENYIDKLFAARRIFKDCFFAASFDMWNFKNIEPINTLNNFRELLERDPNGADWFEIARFIRYKCDCNSSKVIGPDTKEKQIHDNLAFKNTVGCQFLASSIGDVKHEKFYRVIRRFKMQSERFFWMWFNAVSNKEDELNCSDQELKNMRLIDMFVDFNYKIELDKILSTDFLKEYFKFAQKTKHFIERRIQMNTCLLENLDPVTNESIAKFKDSLERIDPSSTMFIRLNDPFEEDKDLLMVTAHLSIQKLKETQILVSEIFNDDVTFWANQNNINICLDVDGNNKEKFLNHSTVFVKQFKKVGNRYILINATKETMFLDVLALSKIYDCNEFVINIDSEDIFSLAYHDIDADKLKNVGINVRLRMKDFEYKINPDASITFPQAVNPTVLKTIEIIEKRLDNE